MRNGRSYAEIGSGMQGRVGPINVISPNRGIFVVFRWVRIRAMRVVRRLSLAPALLLLWGAFIVYVTLLPFDFSASGELIHLRLNRLWERPIRGAGGSWHDAIGNVLLFTPWGLLIGIWCAQRRSNLILAAACGLLTGACLSGSVEAIQLFAPERYASIIDLITNTLGSLFGALIGWPIARWIWPITSVRIRRLLTNRPMTACTLAVMVGLVVAELAPTYVKTERVESAVARKPVRVIPFAPSFGAARRQAATWGAVCLTWVLIGGLIVLGASESGTHGVRTVAWAVSIAGSIAIVIEIIQLVVPGRAADAFSGAVAVVGSAVGATTVMRMPRRDLRCWILPALATWCVATTLAAWSPFQFAWPDRPVWRTEMLVPFWSYFGSRNIEDLTDVINQAIVFAPLGGLLAAQSWKRTFLATIMLGFTWSILLEFGQVFLPARSADMSDAISAAGGAGVGWALWRWGVLARNASMGQARYRVATKVGR